MRGEGRGGGEGEAKEKKQRCDWRGDFCSLVPYRLLSRF